MIEKAKGYIFLCSENTEKECFKRKLLGYKDTGMKHVIDIEVGDSVYLLIISQSYSMAHLLQQPL
jgi:hypothetical protein